MNFLETVLPVKRKEVRVLKQSLHKNTFAQLFAKQNKKIVFIAEIKPKSPSAGRLIQGDPLKLVSAYEQGGADAISVLTDHEFFGGSSELFMQVRHSTSLPLLRKEFIIDESQIIESYRLQADAVLLIAQLLSPRKLKKFIHLSESLGIVPLVEVISKRELGIAIKGGARFIGVNSRDLRTMKVDQQQALSVLHKIPRKIHKLLFSGIENEEHVRTAISSEAGGLLIGTSLLRASNPGEKLSELRKVAEEKLCS